jgi:hypothetical protein
MDCFHFASQQHLIGLLPSPSPPPSLHGWRIEMTAMPRNRVNDDAEDLGSAMRPRARGEDMIV